MNFLLFFVALCVVSTSAVPSQASTTFRPDNTLSKNETVPLPLTNVTIEKNQPVTSTVNTTIPTSVNNNDNKNSTGENKLEPSKTQSDDGKNIDINNNGTAKIITPVKNSTDVNVSVGPSTTLAGDEKNTKNVLGSSMHQIGGGKNTNIGVESSTPQVSDKKNIKNGTEFTSQVDGGKNINANHNGTTKTIISVKNSTDHNVTVGPSTTLSGDEKNTKNVSESSMHQIGGGKNANIGVETSTPQVSDEKNIKNGTESTTLADGGKNINVNHNGTTKNIIPVSVKNSTVHNVTVGPSTTPVGDKKNTKNESESSTIQPGDKNTNKGARSSPTQIAVGKNSSVINNRTTMKESPYLVTLKRNSSFVCGGAIISEYHVITAAYCFNGTKNTSLYQVLKNGSVHLIANLIVHPGYKNGSRVHSLAVLKLEKPIVFDGKTKSSIDVIESGDNSKNESDAKLEGWNMNHPLTAGLKDISESTCNHIHVSNVSSPNEKGLICATTVANGSQSDCFGDSSLLVIDGKLAGISTSHNCKSQIMPIAFIKAAYFNNWIDGIVKQQNLTTTDEPFSDQNNEVSLFFKYLAIFITCLFVVYLCIHLAVKYKVQRPDFIVRFSDYKRL